MLDDTTKLKVYGLLGDKKAPKEISEQLEVPYATVLRLKKTFEDSLENGTISELMDMDKAVLNEIAERAREQLPAEAADSVDSLVKGLSNMDYLQEELVVTASKINRKILAMIVNVEHPSELEILTDALTKLQSSFFNKNVTQVNVQNNTYNTDQPYSEFLSDEPAK